MYVFENTNFKTRSFLMDIYDSGWVCCTPFLYEALKVDNHKDAELMLDKLVDFKIVKVK